MEYALGDLIDLAKVQAIVQRFYTLTGIPPSITDTKGKVLLGVGWQKICLEFHRAHPETCKRCVRSDTELSKNLNESGGYASYNCLNGLVDMAVPIVVGGVHMANLFIGQFFLKEPNLNFFKRQAKQFGFDEKQYMEAVARVPIFEKKQVEDAMLFLAELAEFMGEMGLSNMRLGSLNEALEDKVRERTCQLEEEMEKCRKARAAEVEKSKLQGVLEMAGATAHEFSQPIQSSRSDVDFLMDTVDSDDQDVKDALRSIKANVERMADLVTRVQSITVYKSSPYSGTQNIIDLANNEG